MPTLVIRVVLVQLFGLVGQSGKVDGSFAPTRASSTADSQLAIHPSHLRVYSQIKTQAGLPAMAVLQTLNHFQPNLMLVQQLHQRRHRLLVGHQTVHQTDRPQANHGIAPEFT